MAAHRQAVQQKESRQDQEALEFAEVDSATGWRAVVARTSASMALNKCLELQESLRRTDEALV